MDEAVIGMVEGVPLGLPAPFGPAFILLLEDSPGLIPQPDQRAKLPSVGRAVGSKQRSAVGDRLPLPVVQLADDLVLRNKKMAFHISRY